MKRSLLLNVIAAVLILSSKPVSAQLAYVQHPEPAGVNTNTIRMNDLQVDASNNKWIAFGNYGLGIYDGSVWYTYTLSNSSIPSDSVTCISFDGTNAWIGTKEGATYKSGSTFTTYNTGNSGLPSNLIIAVYHEAGMTWFGTHHGLVSFDGTAWTTYNTSNSGIANDSVTCIIRDAGGKLWVGTRNGLSQYFNNTWLNYTPSNSLLDGFINDIETDNLDRLWVSCGINYGSPISQNTSGIFIIENGVVSNFRAMFLNNEPPISYFNKTNLTRDGSGSIYFRANLYGTTITKVSGNSFSQYLLPYLNYGVGMFGNIFRVDSLGALWSIPGYRFFFYSFDLINYTPPFTDLNFRNHRTLDINDVKAGINVAGDMHWDLSNAEYEVPKGSGHQSVFASALWIGGLDADGMLHTAAQTYRQTGVDYWGGPVGSMSVPFDSSTSLQFDRIWKMYKWRIEQFKNEYAAGNVTNGTYTVPEEIASWPAKGNGVINDQLAPFVDVNGNGTYNPMDGDYPDILGDQMLYYVFNDSIGTHTETGGLKFGVEVQASAYAFNCTNIADSNVVLNRTTLYKYLIINRSTNDYDSVFTGFWSDMDLGNAIDDYVGCDTTLAAGFTYNGDQDDETVSGYGQNPPMQNVKVLRGTLADAGDGIDNDLDGTIDEAGERTSMNHFMYYNNVNNSPVGNPNGADQFYLLMQSKWLDGLQLTYGGDGRNPSNPPTNYMFSGTPYSASGWTESNVGNPPEDRRFLMSSGPVSLNAGDTLTFDIAYVLTWDPINPNGLNTSIARNIADLNRVQYWFDSNTFPSCEVYTVSLPESPAASSISLYPNPVSNTVMVMMDNKMLTGKEYVIFNLQGGEVKKGKLTDGRIDVSKLSGQPYMLRIDLPTGPVVKKLVKM